MTLVHAAAMELDPLARFEPIPQQSSKRVLRQVCGAQSGQGLKSLGFKPIRLKNGEPAQFGPWRYINAVRVRSRAEAAHIVFEAQFAEDLQCAGGEHMCGRVGRTGPFVVPLRGRPFHLRRVAERLLLRLDRHRRSGPEKCSCHYPVSADFGVHHAPGTGVSRDP